MRNGKLRKILSLILAMLMLASLLTACVEEEESRASKKTKKTSSAVEETAKATEPTKENFEQYETEPTFPEPTDEPYSQDDIEPINTSRVAFGEINGRTYTNTYAGFGCTLDSAWSYKSAQELQDLTGYVTGEMFEGTQFENLTKKYPQFTDMLAENPGELTSVNVLFQKLDDATSHAYSLLNEEQLIDLMLSQSETLKQSYAQMGIEVEKFEKVSVTFLDQKRTALAMTSKMYGMPYFTLQLFDYKSDSYSIYLTFASFNQNKTADMLDLFFAVN